MQASLVLTIRSPSACSSMSSQTHPQNVQVAFFTTVTVIRSLASGSFTGGSGRPNRTE